jgi:hypothetical protein
MYKTSLAIYAAAILAGTPTIDEIRGQLQKDKTPSGKNRAKAKAGRKQRQKQSKD